MKLMIASDIHGSAFYCEKMIEAYKREGADRLLLLGDILYHGPRNDLPEGYAPKEVIAMLNPLKSELLCVRGNCDTGRNMRMTIQKNISILQWWKMMRMIDVSMRCKYRYISLSILPRQIHVTIICKNRKFQYHLIYFCITVSPTTP